MADAYDREEIEPLIRIEGGPEEDFDVPEIHQATASPSARSKHFASGSAAVVALTLGACALVVNFFLFQTSGDSKRRSATVEDSVFFASASCDRPKGFCTARGLTFQMRDCDGDGIRDPYCHGNGNCGCIGSSSRCANNWPQACISKPGSVACARPQFFCSGNASLIYSTRDCDGDGQPDPFCQRSDSIMGAKSCGCLQSANNCSNSWPMVCPALDSTLRHHWNTLKLSPGQAPIEAGVAGTLMYVYVNEGEKVSAGSRVAAILNGSQIVQVYSKNSGKVSDLLKLQAGDRIESQTRLAVVNACTDLSGYYLTTPDSRVVSMMQEAGNCNGKTGRGGNWDWKYLVVGDQVTLLDKNGVRGKIYQKGGYVAKIVWNDGYTYRPTDKPSTSTSQKPSKTSTTATTTEKPFQGLPSLEGPGMNVRATGFSGVATLKGCDSQIKAGSFITKGTTICTLKVPPSKSGDRSRKKSKVPSIVDIKAPKAGIVTKIAQIEPSGKVNAGGPIAKMVLVGPVAKLLTRKGLRHLKNPAAGTFKEFRVDVGDKVGRGDTLATFYVNGKVRPVKWTGPDGMVLDRQKLKPGVAVDTDTDLFVFGAGIFDQWRVKPSRTLKKGDTICTMKVGTTMKPFRSTSAGRVLNIAKVKPGDYIGFDQKTPCSITMGHHLPKLKVPTELPRRSKVTPVKGPDENWLKLKAWKVNLRDDVKSRSVFAVAQAFRADGTLGDPVNLTTEIGGYVVSKQKIAPGDIIGPGDVLILLATKELPVVAGFPWWIVIMLIAFCALAVLAFYCGLQSDSKPDSRQDPAVGQPAAAMLQPAGVPLYFDNRPFYFQFHPIGILFQKHAPITIDDFVFNSYGKTLGLTKGMRLTRIVNEDVHANLRFDDVDHKLLAAIKDLPFWPLRVDFRTQTGQVQAFQFAQRPLGILFTKHLPIRVEQFRPNSLAQEKGVQVGWEIVRIGDQDVTSDHSFTHVDKILLDGLAHLPSRK